MKHFFISYNRADQTWAEWIAWQLEEAGYSAIIQAWDFRPGHSFVREMDRAVQAAERTVIVVSPNFFTSRFTPSEWEAAFARDPTGENRLLIPVRVAECDPQGLLGRINYIDLVGCNEADAVKVLLNGLKPRGKPDEPPPFPGSAGHEAVPERPVFPAQTDERAPAPELRVPAVGGRTLPTHWLLGAIILAVVVVAWLFASGGMNVTATGGSSAVGGDVTNSPITVNGGGGTQP